MRSKETPIQREERLLNELNQEILEGKVHMRAHWLPEFGEPIPFSEFDKGVRSEEIVNAQIIGAPETSGEGVLWEPKRFVWGTRDKEVVYAQIGENLGESNHITQPNDTD